MDETFKIPSSSWFTWAPRKWIGVIVSALVLGEAIWVLIASLTRDVILPLMAMATGDDNSSLLSLGKQEFNLPDLFTAVLQLCVAGLFAIVLNAGIQKKPKSIKAKSLNLNPAIPQTAASPLRGAAKTCAPAASEPRATLASPLAAPVLKSSQTASAAPTTPQPAPKLTATALRSAPPQPAPKKPKEVYYNIVGERITPLDDETTEQ